MASWLASSRVGEHDDAAERLLGVLRNYNRCPMDASTRYQFIEQLQPLINDAVNALNGRLSNNTFPLADKPRARFQLIAALIQETGYAYKPQSRFSA